MLKSSNNIENKIYTNIKIEIVDIDKKNEINTFIKKKVFDNSIKNKDFLKLQKMLDDDMPKNLRIKINNKIYYMADTIESLYKDRPESLYYTFTKILELLLQNSYKGRNHNNLIQYFDKILEYSIIIFRKVSTLIYHDPNNTFYRIKKYNKYVFYFHGKIYCVYQKLMTLSHGDKLPIYKMEHEYEIYNISDFIFHLKNNNLSEHFEKYIDKIKKNVEHMQFITNQYITFNL